jgi:hypothetical protein
MKLKQASHLGGQRMISRWNDQFQKQLKPNDLILEAEDDEQDTVMVWLTAQIA